MLRQNKFDQLVTHVVVRRSNRRPPPPPFLSNLSFMISNDHWPTLAVNENQFELHVVTYNI